jgi:hypothetical protein
MRAWLNETRTSAKVRREVSFRVDGGETRTVWWDIEGGCLPSRLTRDDLVPASLIFQAMHQGVDLHVEGRVSRDLLDRLEHFQEIWSLWRPDLYRKVKVTADAEVDVPRRDPKRLDSAVCAFSGGVDGTATAWRHHNGEAGRTSRRLKAGVLIWGFDIPLQAREAWAVASATASATFNDIQAPLALVRTNWRAEVCTEWEMEFATGMLACLRQWDEDVGTLLYGSDEEYSRLTMPWGSHPLVTLLLASQDSAVVYDGGGMSRCQKVAAISRWKAGYDNLRVCWQGEMTGQNCGRCEKCIRTKLNVIASGVEPPASLPGRPEVREVLGIRKMNAVQEALLQEIVDEARKNDIQDPLIDATGLVIARARRRRKLRRAKHLLKTLIKSVSPRRLVFAGS